MVYGSADPIFGGSRKKIKWVPNYFFIAAAVKASQSQKKNEIEFQTKAESKSKMAAPSMSLFQHQTASFLNTIGQYLMDLWF